MNLFIEHLKNLCPDLEYIFAIPDNVESRDNPASLIYINEKKHRLNFQTYVRKITGYGFNVNHLDLLNKETRNFLCLNQSFYFKTKHHLLSFSLKSYPGCCGIMILYFFECSKNSKLLIGLINLIQALAFANNQNTIQFVVPSQNHQVVHFINSVAKRKNMQFEACNQFNANSGNELYIYNWFINPELSTSRYNSYISEITLDIARMPTIQPLKHAIKKEYHIHKVKTKETEHIKFVKSSKLL